MKTPTDQTFPASDYGRASDAAIQSKTAQFAATHSEDLYCTLEQRRCVRRGMLELARTMDTWRLVHALEAHINELSRQIEALYNPTKRDALRAPFSRIFSLTTTAAKEKLAPAV